MDLTTTKLQRNIRSPTFYSPSRLPTEDKDSYQTLNIINQRSQWSELKFQLGFEIVTSGFLIVQSIALIKRFNRAFFHKILTLSEVVVQH